MTVSAVQQRGESRDAAAQTTADAKSFLRELVSAVQARLQSRSQWGATYRLQLQAFRLGFSAAQEIADYLAELGVTHIYSSPCLQTRSGSTHGYDIVDHSRLNKELGSPAEYDRYVETLKRCGLSQILDIVPNHMSVGTDENIWWMDVLRHGPASRYAGYFDIDWRPVNRELEQKVLLPILDDLSGKVLEAGRLKLQYESGAFVIGFEGLRLPLDPHTWPTILSPGLDELGASLGAEHPHSLELQSILLALEHLPDRSQTSAERVAERYRETLVIEHRLRALAEQEPLIRSCMERTIETLNGIVGRPESFNELDRLLGEQAFQLVHWKAGSDELNYRRFFDITELAAVCMEKLDVFRDTHRLVLDLAVQQSLEGFRVDHIDGLFDPAQYLWRLQWEYVRHLGQAEYSRLSENNGDAPTWSEIETAYLDDMHEKVRGPSPEEVFADEPLRKQHIAIGSEPTLRSQLPLFVVVEKILSRHEGLPGEWPVQGTTGYEFLNLLNGLFVDPRGLADLERYYGRFTDQRLNSRETIYQCKRLILEGAMQSELQLLAHRLNRLSNRHRLSRDYTLQALRFALREIMAAFPVYRTYIRGNTISDRDRGVIQQAVAQARRRNPTVDASVFEFIRDVLLLEQPPNLDAEAQTEREFFIGRLQQVTSPVWARAVEDTAFYRRVPLLSVNEVGGELENPCTTVVEFHRQNVLRQKHWPHSLLASSTHDTKRSEDVRARMNVLTEMPGAWQRAVQRWARWNRRHRREVDGQPAPAPSRNDEWMFYQTLVGFWPLRPPTEADRAVLIQRLQDFVEKAAREAKLRTSWINPNPPYDAALREFVANVLSESNHRFLEDFQTFHEGIVDSGLYTALSQVLLKLTSAGIPDVYQGQEVWDFSLVDPDNRRPVDFAYRRALLNAVKSQTATSDDRRSLARSLAFKPRDERIKLLVTWTALQFRRHWPRWEEAEYLPLTVEGACADHVCAFAWRAPDQRRAAIIVAPRLVHTLTHSASTAAPCGPDVWQDTTVVLDRLPRGPVRELITGRELGIAGETLPLGTLLAEFPVALAVLESQ